VTELPTRPKQRGRGDLRAATVKVLAPFGLIVVPVLAYVHLFRIARDDGSLALDFHNEIYVEAQMLLRGDSPFPSLTDSMTHGPNYIWPPLVGYAAAPLTWLRPSVADSVIILLGIACFAAALWIVGVRDWRVYGAASLWGPVIGEMRTAHVTLILCLLVAIVWRTRERTALAGITLGIAVALKFFVWPLALWLAAQRRWLEAGIAAAVAAASLLLLLPFIGIIEYVRLLRRLSDAFDQDGYSPYGLLAQAGVPEQVARVIALSVGLAVLVAAWRRCSFGLFVAAALLLSPIVWLDYYALTAVPLAVVRPRFSWVWLVPILTFGLPSAGLGAGDVLRTSWALAVFGVVVGYTAWREEEATVISLPALRTA
jgi:hypothetical protein